MVLTYIMESERKKELGHISLNGQFIFIGCSFFNFYVYSWTNFYFEFLMLCTYKDCYTVILLQLNSVKYSSLYVYNAAIEKHLHTNFCLLFWKKIICFGLYQNTFTGLSTNRDGTMSCPEDNWQQAQLVLWLWKGLSSADSWLKLGWLILGWMTLDWLWLD